MKYKSNQIQEIGTNHISLVAMKFKGTAYNVRPWIFWASAQLFTAARTFIWKGTMDISPVPGDVAEPQGQVVQGVCQLPSARGVGQDRAAGKPGQAPGCFLPDMLEVTAEGLVDVEQENKVLRLLQMGLMAYMLEKLRGQQLWLVVM